MTDIQSLKYIGPFFKERLSSKGIDTVEDLIDAFKKSSKKGYSPQQQQEKLMKLVYSGLYLNCKNKDKSQAIWNTLPDDESCPFHFSIVNVRAYKALYDALMKADCNITMPRMSDEELQENKECLMRTYVSKGKIVPYDPSIAQSRYKRPKSSSKSNPMRVGIHSRGARPLERRWHVACK